MKAATFQSSTFASLSAQLKWIIRAYEKCSVFVLLTNYPLKLARFSARFCAPNGGIDYTFLQLIP